VVNACRDLTPVQQEREQPHHWRGLGPAAAGEHREPGRRGEGEADKLAQEQADGPGVAMAHRDLGRDLLVAR